ncbi:MAG: PLP-dependent aminotransferase family protein [Nitriliruptoraceae bacterium]|nr:PLP-dependent aminotransferase family protein [Nitriliruptoraceae bacterium]
MDEPIRESGPHLAGLLAGALDGDGPLYRLLSDALKRAIDRGEIPLGTVLPPERSLARSLSVSRATVVAAYDRLKAERWLESRQGSGTWVRTPSQDAASRGDAVATGRLFLADDGQQQRTGPGESSVGRDDLIDLSVAAVAANDEVNRILTSLTLEELSPITDHHGYLPQGLRALRQSIAAHFTQGGLPTGDEHVLVTTGAHQAISLIARQTLDPGDAVLVESPTFPGALDVFRRFGARMIPWPVDADGVRLDVLEDVVARAAPRMLYLSPHFQNPTGTVLSEERRAAIGRIAAEHGIVVLEDLAMGELAIDDVTVPPTIAALTPNALVHTIGSTAKLFWAGLRVGWVRSPDAWAVRMLASKTVADLGTPLVSQLLAVKLLAARDEMLAARRAELRPRRDLMVQVLHERFPEWEFDVPAGGLSIWARLPRGNADELAEVAVRHGVDIVPGPSLSVDDGNRRAVRLVFARPEAVLEAGLDRLEAAWRTYSPTTDRSPARLLV